MFLRGTAGKDVLKGGVEDDTIYGFEGDDILAGGAGNDVIAGHAGADSLTGDAGDDWLIGGAGDDIINGGAGIDWASYEDAAASVTVDLLTTTAQNTGGAGVDRLVAVENLFGSTFDDLLKGNNAANTLNGAAGDDALFGRSGNDALHGGDGDDWIEGGLGNDYIEGGAGSDWAAYEEATRGVTVNLSLATAQNTIGAGVDTLVGIEKLYGSAHADVLTGNNGANSLYGGAGADKLYGGLGADILHGGEGDDLFDGGAGIDTVTFDGAATGVFIQLWLGAGPQQTGFGNDSFAGIENIVGTGHRDWIQGDASANRLYGGDGDDYLNTWGTGDTLLGEGGDDVLTGTVGDHILNGGDGSDTFVVPYTPGGNKVDLAMAGSQSIGGGMSYTLVSVENVRFLMGDNDVYFSNAANTATGGSGVDTYSYRSINEIGKGDKADHIMNWTTADRIDLSRIDANTKVAGDQAFVWAGAFSKQAGQAVAAWDSVNQVTLVQFDVNGDGKADAELYVHGQKADAYGHWIL
jgi:Ca2+-binding RTX toxin-like protein